MSRALHKIREHYDAVAGVYDNRYDAERGKLYYTHICNTILSLIPVDGYLLDIGCGTGLFTELYTERGEAAGLDISKRMIEKAVKRLPDHSFVVGTADRLPFQDESFDTCTSLLAFSYLNNPEKMLNEVYRILKPGGTLAVCTLGKNLFTSGLPAVYSIGEFLKVKKIGVGSFGERYYSTQEMHSLFTKAGYSDIAIKRCSFAHISLVDPLFDIARRMESFVEDKLPYFAYNICARGVKNRF